MINILELVWDVFSKSQAERLSINDFRFVNDFVEREQAEDYYSACKQYGFLNGMGVYKFGRTTSINNSCENYEMRLEDRPSGLSYLWLDYYQDD